MVNIYVCLQRGLLIFLIILKIPNVQNMCFVCSINCNLKHFAVVLNGSNERKYKQ